jgi:hypothetical protein
MNNTTRSLARAILHEVDARHRAQRKLRKDAVLHLRIERDLMERIKAEAQAAKVGISDLVRNRLAALFAEKPAPQAQTSGVFSDTLVWSSGVAVRPAACAGCGAPLAAGAAVWLAHGVAPPARLACDSCHETALADGLAAAALVEETET